ncbi:hypothetical protein KSS87_020641, partial [Heliosperma pusillum]
INLPKLSAFCYPQPNPYLYPQPQLVFTVGHCRPPTPPSPDLRHHLACNNCNSTVVRPACPYTTPIKLKFGQNWIYLAQKCHLCVENVRKRKWRSKEAVLKDNIQDIACHPPSCS